MHCGVKEVINKGGRIKWIEFLIDSRVIHIKYGTNITVINLFKRKSGVIYNLDAYWIEKLKSGAKAKKEPGRQDRPGNERGSGERLLVKEASNVSEFQF